MNLTFPEFYLSRYRFKLVLEEDIMVPVYKGFMLRGVLGSYLKQITCPELKSKCDLCAIQHSCPYWYLFEIKPSQIQPDSNKYLDYPRPYIIHPPLTPINIFKKGEDFCFDIILIGKANNYLIGIISALEYLEQQGLRGDKGKFHIEAIESVGLSGKKSTIYQNGVLKDNIIRINYHDFTNLSQDLFTITLFFETPLRIKVNNKLMNFAPSFDLLINSLFKRTMLLNYMFCSGEYIEDTAQLLEEAHTIYIYDKNVYWQELERYSARQATEMHQGGMIGSITYHGNLTDYLPILQLGELINVGKSVTSGLGKYSLYYGPSI